MPRLRTSDRYKGNKSAKNSHLKSISNFFLGTLKIRMLIFFATPQTDSLGLQFIKKVKGYMEWFEDWFDTPFYHKLYFQRDKKEADTFINNLIGYLKPTVESKMLDVACGKGRHSLTLANNGFDVTGIDISTTSINNALTLSRSNLHFYRHDMRQPFWINYFDYAFNFFTSFGYFRTRREHDAAIRTIAQAIHMNGTLVIDFLNVHYAEDHLIYESDTTLDEYNFHIKKWMDETHFYKKIEVEHDDFEAPHIYTEKVAKFSLGDFTDMLAYQGMQIREVFGDYNLGRYDVRKTPRMIMIAKKIKH